MSHGNPGAHRAPAATPRARRRDANLARILDAAMEIVVSSGFDGLSMHKLASTVDYTPGALYRYFASKDVLIAALATRVIAEFGGVVGANVLAVEGDLRRALVALMTYRDLAGAAPHRFGLISMLLADPRTLVPNDADAASPRSALNSALGPLAAVLLQAEQSGALSPSADPPTVLSAAERGVILFASVHGLLQLRKQEARVPAIANLDRLIALSLRSLLLGWGADPTTLQRDLDAVHALGDLVALAGGLP